MRQLEGQWRWADFPLSQLRAGDAIAQIEKLRSDRPLGLITHVPNLDLVVINLLSPVDHVFWASPIYDDDWGDWSSGRSALRSSPDMKVLRQHLSKEVGSVPVELRTLFGALRPFLASKGSRGAIQGQYLDHLVHRSIAVTSAEVLFVQARLEKESAQFGRFAFLHHWESSGKGSESHLMDAALVGLRPEDYEANTADMEAACHRLLRVMKDATAQVERGTFDIHGMSIRAATGGVVALSLEASMPGAVSMVSLDLQKEVLSWRARLIRLLGWPVLYPAVRFALSVDHPERLSDLNIERPFGLVHELVSFVEEMEDRFEVLRSARLD